MANTTPIEDRHRIFFKFNNALINFYCYFFVKRIDFNDIKFLRYRIKVNFWHGTTRYGHKYCCCFFYWKYFRNLLIDLIQLTLSLFRVELFSRISSYLWFDSGRRTLVSSLSFKKIFSLPHVAMVTFEWYNAGERSNDSFKIKFKEIK